MTMRRDAIYPSIVVGKPPQEDAWLGKATERIFLPAIRATVPEIVDYDLPVAGAFHNCAIVSIRKAFPGHARKVMHAIWGLGMLSLTKAIVVVDAHVDVHDYEQVVFYVGANVDPARDVVLDRRARSTTSTTRPTRQFVGGKLGIDATAKGPEEGAREWPPEIEMSAGDPASSSTAAGPSTACRLHAAGRPAYGRRELRHRVPVEAATVIVCCEATWSRAVNIRTFRARASGRWASPWASSSLLVGHRRLAVARRRRRRHRARLRRPLGARPRARRGSDRDAARRSSPRRRAERRAPAPGRAPTSAPSAGYSRSVFLEVSTLGLGGVIGGARHGARARLHDRRRRS